MVLAGETPRVAIASYPDGLQAHVRETGELMRAVVRRIVEADLPELTRLHQEAFAGYMNVRLGGTYVSRFLDWFRRHDEHIALAAVLEKRAVGYVIGAGEGYLRNLNRDLAGVVALGILRHPWVLARADIRKALRSRARALLVPAAPSAAGRNDCIELVGIGVSSSAQGGGVGHALMQAFEEEARKREFVTMRLSVYASNAVARRFYERDGWTGHGEDEFGAIEYTKELVTNYAPRPRAPRTS